MTDRLLHKVDRCEVRNYLKSLTFPRPLRNYDDFHTDRCQRSNYRTTAASMPTLSYRIRIALVFHCLFDPLVGIHATETSKYTTADGLGKCFHYP